jgi:hypothetical protein
MNQTRNVSGVKDLEACLHDELARAWKEEKPEFNRLKRLARALRIEKVIVSPESASPDFRGYYIYCGWEINTLFAQKWGLSKEQFHSINHKEGPAILIDSDTALGDPGACQALAHEIGHHIYRMAKFTEQEINAPISETMRRLFPFDTYVHQSRDEICAECFAHYLTGANLKSGVERHCDSVLCRVRVHNPSAAKLIESYRRTALNNPQEGNGRV